MSDEMDDITKRRVERAKRAKDRKQPELITEQEAKDQGKEALNMGVEAYLDYQEAVSTLARLISRVGIQIAQESNFKDSFKDFDPDNYSVDMVEATKKHAERMIQDAAEAAMEPIKLLVVPIDGGSLDDTHEALLVEYATEIVNAEELEPVLERLRNRFLHCPRPAVVVQDDMQYVQEFHVTTDEEPSAS